MTTVTTDNLPRKRAPIAAGILCASLLLAALVGLGVNVHYRSVQSPAMRTDYLCFHLVWQAALSGDDIYAVADPRGWKVHYPPGMAALFAPMGWLTFEQGVVIWYIISAAALVWCCARIVMLCDELAGRPVGPIVVAAVLINLAPIFSGLQRGQFSVLLFALVVEALWHYRRDRSTWAGAFIGLAASIKGYPALAMWPLIVRRDWRAITGFAVTAAFVTVALPMIVMGPSIGLDTVWRFVGEKLLPLLGSTNATQLATFDDLDHYSPTNQSAYAVLARYLCDSSTGRHALGEWAIADLPVKVARGISLALGAAAMVVIALLALRRSDRRGMREALLWTLPMLAAHFISTIAWHHYYAVLTLPYALVGVVAVTKGAPLRRLLATALFISIACNLIHFIDTQPVEARLMRRLGLLLAGSLVLWLVIAAYCARRPPSPSAPAQGYD